MLHDVTEGKGKPAVSAGVHGNQKCCVQRHEVPRSATGTSRGRSNEELRAYYPAFCSAGALPVLRGIAALFRCLAERQVNLARLGIEAILFSERQNQRDDLIAFLW